MKSNNIEFILPSELFSSSIFIEWPTYLCSSADTGYTGDLTGSLGSNNPSTPDPPSASQSGNPGSNNNSTPEPVRDFDDNRRRVGAKLRDLYIHKPRYTFIKMTHPDYSNRISV